MTTLLELVVFLAPPLRPDADLPCASRPVKPRAQLNPCNNSHPSTRRLETNLGRARQHIVHLQCLRGGYFANLFTLTQVYAGVVVGTHRPSYKADGEKCKKELCWVNKLCTEVGNKLRNFFGCACWCGVTLVCAVASYEKSLRISGGFAFTMVETRGIEPLTS